MADVVVFGTNDFGEMLALRLEQTGSHRVAAFTVDREYLPSSRFSGRDAVAYEDLAESFPPAEVSMFVAVGPSHVNRLRARIVDRVRQAGYRLISYVSPEASICPNISYGENCCFFDRVVIEPFCSVGEGSIFWSGAMVAHHSVVGRYCFMAPAAAVSGRCSIGDYAFLGINSTVRDHVSIGEGCIVGAGALIKKDTEPFSVHSAQPTRQYLADSRGTRL